MNKKILLIYLISLCLVVLDLLAGPPGFGGERPCSCDHTQHYYEWCTQWCAQQGTGECNGEVFKWGCWCRNPGAWGSFACDCGYIVICYDPLWASPQFSLECFNYTCGINY